MQAYERAAEFDQDAGIGRQIAVADDAADRTLAADQNGLDVAAVLVGDQIRRQAWSAGKMDDLDIIAGIIEQVTRDSLFGREMRRDQREVLGAEPPQQVVERAIRTVRSKSAWRYHSKNTLIPRLQTITDRID